MAKRIVGITVNLINQVQTGTDPFGNPIFTPNTVSVQNVLVAPSSSDDIVDSTQLYGKKAVYTIAVPKGDTNVWENQIVEFFGHRWHVFSFPMEGIEANIPLSWNAKYYVERFV